MRCQTRVRLFRVLRNWPGLLLRKNLFVSSSPSFESHLFYRIKSKLIVNISEDVCLKFQGVSQASRAREWVRNRWQNERRCWRKRR